jgi:GTPase SAR1 family protein
VELRDTNGKEDYERLTAMAFAGSDAFIMCFSLIDRQSFNNITTKWNDGTWKVRNIMDLPRPTPMNPLHYVVDGTPVILVGCKCDKSDERMVSKEEGEQAAREIKAVHYMECSALTGKGVREVFIRAVLEATEFAKTHNKKKKKCIIA